MSPGQTFESDLRAVREARGLSLGEIHQQTRIPVDVLRRFEEGDLVQDPTYNEVYLKAFLQSYAKAVGVPASAVVVAFEDQKAGAYRGALHPGGDEEPEAPRRAPEPAAPPTPRPTEPAPPPSKAPSKATPSAEEPAAPSPSEPAPPPPRRPATAPPAVAALKNAPDPETRAASAEPPKTLAEARVNRPAVAGANRSFDKNWSTILGLFVVVLVLIAGALYFLVFAGDDRPEPADEPVAVGADAEEAPAPDSAQTGPGTDPAAARGPQLQLPIRVVLVAGGDGLQSFRVTEDDGARRPYWIEPGDRQTFEGQQSVVLWGEDPTGDFSEATVEIQGLRFTPPSGQAFRIDAASGQRLLDSLATAGAGAAAAPAAAPTPAE